MDDLQIVLHNSQTEGRGFPTNQKRLYSVGRKQLVLLENLSFFSQ